MSGLTAAGCYSGIGGGGPEGEDPGGDGTDGADGVDDAADGADDGADGADGADDDGADDDDDDAGLGPAIGRRLIREEYFNSIEAALGVDLDPAAYDMPEDFRLPTGFRNTADELLLSPGRIEAYDTIAGVVADQVDMAALLAEHAACTDATEECRDGFVADLGLRLLRGPVPAAERELYVLLFGVSEEEGDGFEGGARLVVRAMLQSPRFLYRLESQDPAEADADGLREIDDYELATRLSFLIWNAAPDLELIRAADSGDLQSSFDAQVQRLLDHPRARRALRQYIEQWLYLGAAPANLLLRDDMQEETYRLFERIVWEDDADFMSAFVSQEAELSGALAEFYGLTSQGPEPALYDLSELPERIGFTTTAGVMAARTVNPESSIIDRGLFVLRDVLCGNVPPPEGEELEDAIDENTVPADSGLSQRERFAMQRENPLCAGCHGTFDPLGLPYEQYGAAGEFMEQDEFGNVLTGQSDVTFADIEGSYDDVGQFVQALSGSETVARCMVNKSLQHAWGRVLGPDDAALLDDLHEGFETEGRSYRALLTSIAEHPLFRRVQAAD